MTRIQKIDRLADLKTEIDALCEEADLIRDELKKLEVGQYDGSNNVVLTVFDKNGPSAYDLDILREAVPVKKLWAFLTVSTSAVTAGLKAKVLTPEQVESALKIGKPSRQVLVTRK